MERMVEEGRGIVQSELKIPNSKSQIPNKLQIPNIQTLSLDPFWIFVI
jgi:hypothetical protein